MCVIGRIALGRLVAEGKPCGDLRRFSDHLLVNRLAGTIEKPLASKTDNPAVAAAIEVRTILERLNGELPA
jgi:hypothetical protein